MEGLEWAMRGYDKSKPFDTGAYMNPMRAAVARLQMSRKEAGPIADILIHWPGELSQLAENYKKAVGRDALNIDDILNAVTEVSTNATVALPWCTSMDKARKRGSVDLLQQTDIDLKAALSKFESSTPK